MGKISQKHKSENNNSKNEKKIKDKSIEKPDKINNNLAKVKEIKDNLKKYEEIGLMIAGDVIYNKASRKDIKYYKNSELVFKPEFGKKIL